jgi:hypothetical protein
MGDAMSCVRELEGVAASRFRERHAALVRRLQGAGVTRIVAHYDGQEETGHFYDVKGFAGDRARELPIALLEELREHLHDALEARCGAWQLADGSCGEFEWDIGRDASHHTHRIRKVSYKHTRYLTWSDLLGAPDDLRRPP